MYGRRWELGLTEEVNPLVSNCESLQRGVSMIGFRGRSFSSPPWAKRVGKLRNGEDTLLGVLLDLLLSQTANQAEVVLVDSLVVAAFSELTYSAMVVQEGCSQLQAAVIRWKWVN